MKLETEMSKLKAFDMSTYTGSFVSGKQQNYIKIKYFYDEELMNIYAETLFHKEAQGAPGIVHGGAIAAVLDESMGAASFLIKHPAVTATITVDYRKPLPVEKIVIVRTWIEKVIGKKIFICGKLYDSEKTIYANSKGLFIKVTKEEFNLEDNDLLSMF